MTNLNKKITSNKSKHLLVENELKKLKTFDSPYFKGKHFAEDYLVFKPMYKYFNKIGSTKRIAEWKSKRLPDEVIKSSNNSLAPILKFTGERKYVKFSGRQNYIQSWKNSEHIHFL